MRYAAANAPYQISAQLNCIKILSDFIFSSQCTGDRSTQLHTNIKRSLLQLCPTHDKVYCDRFVVKLWVSDRKIPVQYLVLSLKLRRIFLDCLALLTPLDKFQL